MKMALLVSVGAGMFFLLEKLFHVHYGSLQLLALRTTFLVRSAVSSNSWFCLWQGS